MSVSPLSQHLMIRVPLAFSSGGTAQLWICVCSFRSITAMVL